jgi:hypothetical protein
MAGQRGKDNGDMTISAIILRDDFESAVSAAQAMGTVKNIPGLAAPLDAAWSGRINEVWDRIESALRTAFERGRDAAQSLTTKAIEQAEQLIADAGHRAYDVQQALLSRLQAYITRLTDAALGRVRPELQLGATTWRLESVELAEKISLTGSLSANITSLVTVTAGGELTVTAKYAVTTETTPPTSATP